MDDGGMACLYAFEGMADWEYGHLVAELNSGRYFAPGRPRIPVRLAGIDGRALRPMGGRRLLPDLGIGEVVPEDWAILILPGGDSWLEPVHRPALDQAPIEFAHLALGLLGVMGEDVLEAWKGFLTERSPHAFGSFMEALNG